MRSGPAFSTCGAFGKKLKINGCFGIPFAEKLQQWLTKSVKILWKKERGRKMWARVVEFMLACWLAISPFIFRYPGNDMFLWANDFVCASLVALFALLSFWHPLRNIHLLTLGVALWLWCMGYRSFPE